MIYVIYFIVVLFSVVIFLNFLIHRVGKDKKEKPDTYTPCGSYLTPKPRTMNQGGTDYDYPR